MPLHLSMYEEPREFTASNGVRWRRTGYCNRCGACCSNNGVPDVTGVVDGSCAYYREQDGLGSCVGRESAYYFAGCVDWPSAPKLIANYPLCSYRFERVE